MALTVAYLDHWGEACGGGQRSLLDLLALRESLGVKPVVLLGGEGPLQAAVEAAGARARVMRYPSLRKRPRHQRCAVMRLRACLLEERADLVHANSLRSALYAIRAAGPIGIPVVAHVRVHRPPTPLALVIDQWVALRAQAIIANSRSVARRFRWMPKRARVYVVGNGIRLQASEPHAGESLRRRLGIDPAAPVLAVIGMLEPRKGHRVLLRALALVKRKFPECRLLIAGGPSPGYGGFRRILEDEARRQQVEDSIHWLGEVNVTPVLEAMDMLVHPVVRREGFGRVVAESFAAGKPVVVSRMAALDELVEDRISGFFAAPGNAADLAAKIEELIASPELRRDLGANGRERVERDFSFEGMAGALRRVYEDVAAS